MQKFGIYHTRCFLSYATAKNANARMVRMIHTMVWAIRTIRALTFANVSILRGFFILSCNMYVMPFKYLSNFTVKTFPIIFSFFVLCLRLVSMVLHDRISRRDDDDRDGDEDDYLNPFSVSTFPSLFCFSSTSSSFTLAKKLSWNSDTFCSDLP